MSSMLSRRVIVSRLRKHRPATPRDARNIGLDLRFIGSGAYRRTYEVLGHGLIIKFPSDGGKGRKDRDHTLQEIAVIRRIKKTKRLRPLRRYLPRVIDCDREGNYILVEKYAPSSLKHESGSDVLASLIVDLGSDDCDLHRGNICVDSKNHLRIVDFGIFDL